MDNNILEKIQKLLAMAEHHNSNENEAAIALEKAQALLLRHNLTRADVINTEAGTPQGIGKITKTETDGYSWKRYLIARLAETNLCKVVGSPQDKAWHLFGSYDNVRTVLEMYNWVSLQLVFMANREYQAYKNDEGTECSQTWKAGFYQGAIQAIHDRLKKPMEEFSQGIGHALVISNKTIVSDAIRKVFPHLTSSSRRVNGGYDGRSAGRNAGGNMNLTPQKSLSSQRLALC